MLNRAYFPCCLVLVLAGASLSCSQARPPAAQTAAPIATPATAVDVGPRAAQVAVAEEPSVVKPYGEKLVVIESGEAPVVDKPKTLVEAAQAERLRRQLTERSRIVITDENLQDFATGELTFTDESFNQSSNRGMAEQSIDSSALLSQESEEKWRARLLEMRLGWRDRAAGITVLEAEVAKWRQRFYLEEDNYHRDNQVKPAWDRSLQELELARAEAADIQRRLEAVMDEGRRAGVPPGWLREGIEFEPRKTLVEEKYVDPGEPVILEEYTGGGR